MKLAIAQMVLGVLIVAGVLVKDMGIFRWLWFMIPYLPVIVTCGLLVLGCGVAQFLKARR